VYCYLSNFRFSDLGSTSSITEAVNSKIIKQMSIKIPPNGELSVFCENAKPLFEAIKLNAQELIKLTNLANVFLSLLSR
ncbi:MAG: restriction endonuclease subunit S, partial [Clostridiales bacterium]|nr:restriction endonuclease subunit S [Clostridiales bacterium]